MLWHACSCAQHAARRRAHLLTVRHARTHARRTACRRQFFREQHAQLESELFAAHRDAFPAAQYDHASFAWAVASVRSRLHAPLDAQPLALVPLADAVSRKQQQQ